MDQGRDDSRLSDREREILAALERELELDEPAMGCPAAERRPRAAPPAGVTSPRLGLLLVLVGVAVVALTVTTSAIAAFAGAVLVAAGLPAVLRATQTATAAWRSDLSSMWSGEARP